MLLTTRVFIEIVSNLWVACPSKLEFHILFKFWLWLFVSNKRSAPNTVFRLVFIYSIAFIVEFLNFGHLIWCNFRLWFLASSLSRDKDKAKNHNYLDISSNSITLEALVLSFHKFESLFRSRLPLNFYSQFILYRGLCKKILLVRFFRLLRTEAAWIVTSVRLLSTDVYGPKSRSCGNPS